MLDLAILLIISALLLNFYPLQFVLNSLQINFNAFIKETINGNAFNKCIGLNTIYIPSSVKTINIKGNWYSGAPFTKCSPNLKIYCGAKSKQSGWHQYWNCDGSNTSSNKVSVTYNITRAVYLSKYKK